MSTTLRVGDLEIATYRNMVQFPVPFSGTHITTSFYSGNPAPGAVVTYRLDQVDGPTTRSYGQYLEDYARITVPLLGAGTEADPYYFYPYPVLVRCRVNVTPTSFQDHPYINLFHHVRAYAGVRVRMNVFWYTAGGVFLTSTNGTPQELTDSEWNRLGMVIATPPQSILNQAGYFYFGVEIMSGMGTAVNYFDVTGFRASPAQALDFNDWRGTYFDGSTTFPQSNYVGAWTGTPRSSASTLTVTEISSLTEETDRIESLSVAEDVTGLNAASISGGAGQATVAVPYKVNTPNYMSLAAEVHDYSLGSFYGRIRDIDQSPEAGAGNVNLMIDESLSLLNAWVTAPPMSGTLATVLRNYVALAEAPIRAFAFEDGLDLVTINTPGFVGNLYDKVRELLAAHGAELLTVNGVHVVRAPLKDKVVLENFTETPNNRMNLQETSEYVRVHWYDNEYVTNGQVFPLAANPDEPAEEVPEATVYSVGAGETLSVDIQLRASLLSVNVPTYVSFVPDEDVTGTGIYTAVGSDSLPITPSQWAAGGGSIDVTITEDPSVIKVTITGPNFPTLAPFRLAMSSGSGNYYNALRITGTGVFLRDQAIDLATGAAPAATGQKYAVECTNPYISSKEQALQAGHIVAGRVAQSQTLSFSVPTPENLSAPSPVLGLLPGAKFVYGNQQYRIITTDVNKHTISGTAEFSLPSEDFDAYFGGTMTSTAFDALYASQTANALNFSLQPLLHRTREV